MKSMTIAGVVLIILGVFALVYRSVTYTENETLFKVGPVQAEAETQETIALPPVLGLVAIIGGVVLVDVGMRKR